MEKPIPAAQRALLVGCVLLLAVLACNAGTSSSGAATEAPPTAAASTGEQTTALGGEQAPPATGDLSSDQIEQISQAVVQIIASQGTLDQAMWTGSGTVISPTGRIVTNCHVACGAPVLYISMTSSPDQPPEPRYIAQVTHYDELLDIALLDIVTDMQGNPVTVSDLPYLETGNSDELRLGDKIYLFGYPGVGGQTITFTSGSVSGFENADLGDATHRVTIKTDAGIASGNSGGTAVDTQGRLVAIPTAVNSDVREGVTLGGIGILRPANLIAVVEQQSGAPPPAAQAELPPEQEPDPYEPNNTLDQAVGPLSPGDSVNGYITWEQDADVFWIQPNTTATITVILQAEVPGADYDLWLLNAQADLLAVSETETSNERIDYTPAAAGPYWIAVVSYSGMSTSAAYTLSVDYDGDTGGSAATGITITGRAVGAGTGQPVLPGGFGILRPDITCSAFFGSGDYHEEYVVGFSEANQSGEFRLDGVPSGEVYPAFFVYGDNLENYVCENGWLQIPADSGPIDLGTIEIMSN
jgi:S1-C subfamily serine protease